MVIVLAIIVINNYYVDINECTLGYDGCNQNCVNTEGSYLCYCTSGYHLDVNKKTCIG